MIRHSSGGADKWLVLCESAGHERELLSVQGLSWLPCRLRGGVSEPTFLAKIPL